MKLTAKAALIGCLALALSGCPGRDRTEAPPKASPPGPNAPSSPSVQQALAPPPAAPRAKPPFAVVGRGSSGTQDLSDVAERSVRSVVNIASTRLVSRRGRGPVSPLLPFPRRAPQRSARSLGSGVIVSADGVVLTNNHVVARAKDIKVTLTDGRELSAKIVGSDEKSDLAVLRIEGKPKDLYPMPLGKSGTLRLGEVVLAIGNPFGVGQTVTMGIVSAKGRANMGIVDYEDFIQTDAAINPGNSGGALVDTGGNLVGINTAILSRTGGYQGIGFAIPTDMAKPIMESLLNNGRVVRGWLGVSIQELSKELSQALGGPSKGVLVVEVEPNSPAQKGGLRRDDVIVRLNGKEMASVVRLRNTVASTRPGSTVKLQVLRADRTVTLAVKLGELPSPDLAELDRDAGSLGGLSVETLDDALRTKFRLPPQAGGVVVTRVQWGSAAESAGLKEGDLIVEFDRKPVPNAQALAQLYAAADGKILLLVFRRNEAGQPTTLYLILEK